MSANISHADERYRQDPVFKTLVDHLYHLLRQMESTPTELREALFLAQYKFELERPFSVPLSPGLIEEFERVKRAKELRG